MKHRLPFQPIRATQRLGQRPTFLVALLLSSSSVAHAAGNDEDPFAPTEDTQRQASVSSQGPELGVSMGIASPSGKLQTGERLNDLMSGVVPFEVDAGYRLFSKWMFGGYLQYGFGIRSETSKSDCSSCAYSWLRYGLQAHYSIVRNQFAHVWVGVGTGAFSLDKVDNDTNLGESYSGWEVFNLRFGGSWRPSSGVELGPVFVFGYSSIDNLTPTCFRINKSECPRSSAKHLSDAGSAYWSMTGLRVVFLP